LKPTTFNVARLADLYYLIIITQMAGEISEAKASELLGMGIEKYRDVKDGVVQSVLTLLESLPSPLILLLEGMKGLQGSSTVSGSSSKSRARKSGSRRKT
jgi:hypothetical protein